MAEPKLAYIPLKQIRENPVALRPVDKESEEYKGLVESIRKEGVLNPINVREIPNPENPQEPRYSIIDGLHRYTASVDAGREVIPAQVLAKDDAEVLEAQIIANVHKVETKPAQYSKQLIRLMGANPLLTTNELAARLGKSPTWLAERMGLVKLTEPIQKMVDDGRIKVSNAVSLAKLPADMQADFVDRAMTQTPGEFVPAVQAALKAHREAIRAGKDPNAVKTFTPVAFLQRLAPIKEAAEHPEALAQTLIARAQPKNLTEAFQLALKWVLHLDPVSVDAQKEKWEAAEKAKAEKKEAAKKEREAKKNAEGAAAAVEAGA